MEPQDEQNLVAAKPATAPVVQVAAKPATAPVVQVAAKPATAPVVQVAAGTAGGSHKDAGKFTKGAMTLPSVVGKTGAPRRKWTSEEDEILRQAVEQCEGKNWKKIAEYFTDRSARQCFDRWRVHLNPALAKGPWEKEEDEMILAWVEQHGPVKWNTLAAERVKGRTGKMCNERWQQVLNPDLAKGPWEKEEDEMILAWVEEHGPVKWNTLAAERVKGRTGKKCRQRWHDNLNPTLAKGPWEKEEDEMILAWVEEHGPVKWNTLAAERVKGRTGKMCRARWQQVLNPDLAKGPWEKEEDEMILAWVEEHGPVKWNTLAAERVKGRTGRMCRQRWHVHLNPDIKQGKKKRKYEEGAGGSRSEGAKQQKRSQGSRENAMARRAEVVVKRESDQLLSDGLIHLRCTSAAPPLNLSTLTPSSPYELGYVEAKIGEDESADWALFLSKQFDCLRPYGDHWLLKALIYPEGVASNPHYDHRICLRVIFTYVEHPGGVKRFLYGTSRTDMLSTMLNHDIVGATVVTDSPHGGAMMFSSHARGALHRREIVVDLEDEKETCKVIPKEMPCPTPTTEPPYHAGCAAQNGACGSVVADLMLKDNSYERQAIEAFLESERNRGEFSPPPPPPYLTGVEDFLRRARDEGEDPNCPHASTRIDWIDLN